MHLTVAVPTRNRADLLAACLTRLESLSEALAAAGHQLAVLVGDNASQDDTQAVLARRWRLDLRHFRRTQSAEIYGSIAGVMLRACAGPGGEAVVLLGDDDWLNPETVRCALDRLEASPALLGVAGAMSVERAVHPSFCYQVPPGGGELIVDHRNLGAVLEEQSYLEAAILRRRCWRDLHPYVEIGLPCHSEALIRFVLSGPLLWLPTPLIHKSAHAGSETVRIGNDYHAVRTAEDFERALAELVRHGLLAEQFRPFGRIPCRTLLGSARHRSARLRCRCGLCRNSSGLWRSIRRWTGSSPMNSVSCLTRRWIISCVWGDWRRVGRGRASA